MNNPSAGGNTGVEASAAALEERQKNAVGFDSLGAVKANHVIPLMAPCGPPPVGTSSWTALFPASKRSSSPHPERGERTTRVDDLT